MHQLYRLTLTEHLAGRSQGARISYDHSPMRTRVGHSTIQVSFPTLRFGQDAGFRLIVKQTPQLSKLVTQNSFSVCSFRLGRTSTKGKKKHQKGTSPCTCWALGTLLLLQEYSISQKSLSKFHFSRIGKVNMSVNVNKKKKKKTLSIQ